VTFKETILSATAAAWAARTGLYHQYVLSRMLLAL